MSEYFFVKFSFLKNLPLQILQYNSGDVMEFASKNDAFTWMNERYPFRVIYNVYSSIDPETPLSEK